MVELKVSKSANEGYVFIGLSNVINYSVIIENIGDTVATNVKIRDVISKGACFIPGTFKVNSCELKVNNINNYINIGSINPGTNVIVTFSVEVIKYFLVNEIINKVIVSYSDEKCIYKSVESNELITPIINVKICAQKQADKSNVCIGEVISYTITIRNTGNIDIDKAIFFDRLSPNVELLPASILINGYPQNIESMNDGIFLGTIKSNSSVIIQFQVKVISSPKTGYIYNLGRFEYYYTILNNGVNTTSIGDTFTNKVKTRIINELIPC